MHNYIYFFILIKLLSVLTYKYKTIDLSNHLENEKKRSHTKCAEIGLEGLPKSINVFDVDTVAVVCARRNEYGREILSRLGEQADTDFSKPGAGIISKGDGFIE